MSQRCVSPLHRGCKSHTAPRPLEIHSLFAQTSISPLTFVCTCTLLSFFFKDVRTLVVFPVLADNLPTSSYWLPVHKKKKGYFTLFRLSLELGYQILWQESLSATHRFGALPPAWKTQLSEVHGVTHNCSHPLFELTNMSSDVRKQTSSWLEEVLSDEQQYCLWRLKEAQKRETEALQKLWDTVLPSKRNELGTSPGVSGTVTKPD